MVFSPSFCLTVTYLQGERFWKPVRCWKHNRQQIGSCTLCKDLTPRIGRNHFNLTLIRLRRGATLFLNKQVLFSNTVQHRVIFKADAISLAILKLSFQMTAFSVVTASVKRRRSFFKPSNFVNQFPCRGGLPTSKPFYGLSINKVILLTTSDPDDIFLLLSKPTAFVLDQ